MDAAAAAPGLMLGTRRRAVDGDTTTLYGATASGHRGVSSNVPPHGMLPLLSPWHAPC